MEMVGREYPMVDMKRVYAIGTSLFSLSLSTSPSLSRFFLSSLLSFYHFIVPLFHPSISIYVSIHLT